MGYELDKLMGQYGVSTPSLSYSGSARPVMPAAQVATPTAEQTKAYEDAMAKYNVAMPNYTADQAKYGDYKAGYMNRIANTPMYGADQFNRGVIRQPAPPGMIMPIEPGGDFGLPPLPVNRPVLSQPTYSAMSNVQPVSSAVPGVTPLQNTPTINDLYSMYLGGSGDSSGDGGPGGNSGDSGNGGPGTAGNAGADGDGGPGGVGAWADGGYVKTHFKSGGLNDMADQYGVGAVSNPVETRGVYPVDLPELDSMAMPSAAPTMQPPAAPTMQPPAAPPMAVQSPVAPPMAVQQGMGGRTMPPGLMDMIGKYQGEGVYGPELKAARLSATRENDAFNKLLQDAISKKTDNTPSKAEMYFRLAAAFGAPTKTGGFSENLANVGKTLSEYSKETREAEKAGSTGRLALGIEAQRAKMTGAKEDLTTLRTLASEEMKDKRAIVSKMMEEYIKSGQPQSSAGKQAVDEGLAQGTPQFQKRVSEIAELNIEKQTATINNLVAGMSLQQAAAGLAQQKFDLDKTKSEKLTSPEIRLKTDTEDMVAQTGQALGNLKKAYALNPDTFDSSLVDQAQFKVLSAAGSKDLKSQNTTEMTNLLEKAALSQLKSTFPGAISNDERKALMDVQGLGAKSIEARGKIMINAYKALQAIEERSKKRLNEINKGLYRDTQSSGGIE